MKRLLLTTSIFAVTAAIGGCAGEDDSNDVYDPLATASTTGSTAAPNTPGGPTGSQVVSPVTPTAGPQPTSGPQPPTPSTTPTGPQMPAGTGGAPPVSTDPTATPAEPEPPAPFCGDGNVDAAESCDDGNRVAADGCENDCTESIVAAETCGDGMPDDGEACDDGNMEPGDGCENNCTVTPAAAVCGDGTRDPDEDCDDGNMEAGDGCENDCTETPPPEPMCGNGMVEGTEACDDGNMDLGDGCENDCTATPAPAEVTLAELVGDLDGRLLVTPCGDTPGTDDCNGGGWSINGGPLNMCQGGSLDARSEHAIGGVPGTTYNVTMHFYGVMEPKNYGNNAQREAGGSPNRNPAGTPTPWATANPGTDYSSSNYNTYEIHVDNENMEEVGLYYLNADTGDGHYTFGIDYEKTIPIIGGGRIRLRTFDLNCRQIKNCSDGGTPCSGKARVIDISAADPQPDGAWLQQPGLGQTAEHSGQWWLIDVTAFTPAQ